MEKEFINYEQAVILKELGFNEPCLAFYNGKFLDSTEYNFDSGDSKDIGLCLKAPLKQQVYKWFREKHNLLGNVYSNASGWGWEIHDNIGGTGRFGSGYSGDCEESGMFTSFEKASTGCIEKLIEIVKNK